MAKKAISKVLLTVIMCKGSRLDQKGTDFIKEIMRRHKIPLRLITDLAHQEALKRKAHVDLFVYQISYKKFQNVDCKVDAFPSHRDWEQI